MIILSPPHAVVTKKEKTPFSSLLLINPPPSKDLSPRKKNISLISSIVMNPHKKNKGSSLIKNT
jgi:hypothetical protein